MTGKKERGLFELYQQDPERADRVVFGRVAHSDRRGFLKGAGLATMGAVLGASIPFHRNMPVGLIPEALAQSDESVLFETKDGLTLLNDRPINAETPAHLLDDAITPNDRFFIRNNGLVPQFAIDGDAGGWTLTVDGEVNNPLELTLDDLRSNFETVSYELQLECGGNGRSAFNPPARGNQWTVGAIGNAVWTGVRYADVLGAAGVKDTAVYTGHFGLDPHLSGDPTKTPISRGVPLWKAMEPHSLIAFEMNGEPIPALHGFPVRTVCAGWPGSASQKWLNRIQVRADVHDGPKMGGQSYRMPAFPVAPGDEVAHEDMRIMESMPVKSIITSPRSESVLPLDNRSIGVRGHAWAGERSVARVDLSIDFGATWIRADLDPPANKYAWQTWRQVIRLPSQGYYEIWSRATDEAGTQQPFTVGWNPRGYGNNAMHRVSLRVPS
ncbi:sulfite oxidase [Algihabitans albus]|uniref:sulfite oxidase n=1 Tax=Algihabitans albus TaxID=2164067 RepID=UPI0035CF9ECC